MKTLRTIQKFIWRHRVTYAAFAAVYGCGFAGWLEKDTVALVASALYAILFIQRH